MTDEELLKMAYDALVDEGDTVKKSIAMHYLMARLETPPRPISGQAMVRRSGSKSTRAVDRNTHNPRQPVAG